MCLPLHNEPPHIIQGNCINYIVKTRMTSFQKVFIEHQCVKVYIRLLWRRFINVYIFNNPCTLPLSSGDDQQDE